MAEAAGASLTVEVGQGVTGVGHCSVTQVGQYGTPPQSDGRGPNTPQKDVEGSPGHSGGAGLVWTVWIKITEIGNT